ncbi:hypothetical protein CCAX7_56220 [Capsulimonas corticalis]|uniref:Uncharacterized protein n=1 Tax=Capsulimonas corticalis TaxID=2219043 RepID=A0A402D0Q4_9BACT|nr:hypothetical protein [Capsulimonas corticalis]BDI33571.1 hypothetical protein CCAX7_56220 [Capsulimonas corticalis]
MDLKERGLVFLNRAIPEEMASRYAPGSMADMLIAGYVQNGVVDAEIAQFVGICAFECREAAKKYSSNEAKAYFYECADILDAIDAQTAPG